MLNFNFNWSAVFLAVVTTVFAHTFTEGADAVSQAAEWVGFFQPAAHSTKPYQNHEGLRNNGARQFFKISPLRKYARFASRGGRSGQ